jgi:uncharacterized protein (TIGR02453 family)
MNISKIAKFLTLVKKHNNTEYFDTVRDIWAEIKIEVTEFTSSLMHDMQVFDGGLALIDPKSTLYRINRDIRFSKDKSPYKSWVAVGITPQKKSDMKPTYYFHIDFHGNIEYGAGAWGAKSEDAKTLRSAILKHPTEFKTMINSLSTKGYALDNQFKKSRVPNGYPKDHELSEYLKYASFAVDGQITDAKDLTEQEIHTKLLNFYQNVSPLVLWARKAIKHNTTNA